MHVLDVTGNALIRSCEHHMSFVTAIALDDEFLASTGYDGRVVIRSLYADEAQPESSAANGIRPRSGSLQDTANATVYAHSRFCCSKHVRGSDSV